MRSSLARPGRVTGLALAGVLIAALPAQGQDRSVLSLLDPQGRTLRLGGEVQGTLEAGDPVSTAGRRIQLWTVRLEAGQGVQVDLVSRDFDPYLTVVGPGLGAGLEDDDTGGGLNARICFQAESSGEYRVAASALSAQTGAFELSLLPNEGPCGAATGDVTLSGLDEITTAGRFLLLDETVEGVLTDDDPGFSGRRVQAWGLPLDQGEEVTVDLLSQEFDAYLTVLGPGLQEWLTDDDGAGGCNARVTFQAPEEGEYRVVASALSGGVGAFQLAAYRDAEPPTEESCDPSIFVDAGEAGTPLTEVAVVGGLGVPGVVVGRIQGDEVLHQGRPLQGWRFAATEGSRLALTLRSSDFDAFLYLTGPEFPDALTDDDSGGNLDSRVCVSVPADGEYVAYAGPLSEAPVGASYELEIQAGDDAETLCQGRFELSPARVVQAVVAMDAGGRRMGMDETVQDVVEEDDPRHPLSDQIVRPWRLQGEPGVEVTVDVLSVDFDPFLRVVWEGVAKELYDDDTGDCLNSRLTFVIPESGEVLLLPGPLFASGAGTFTLRASTDPGPLDPDECPDRSGAVARGQGQAVDGNVLEGIVAPLRNVLPLGAEMESMLVLDAEARVEGVPAEAWRYQGQPGELVAFEVVSDDFDPVLYLAGDGLESVLFDDDSAGAANSRIEITVPDSGTLLLVVSAYSEGSGSYRIRALRRMTR